VRYGFEGVGEDYIEEASWLRVSELMLSYTATFQRSKIREVKFSLIGHNLLMLTSYSGVDPASSLFGYQGSTGLDLFNLPSTRNYTAQFTIKI
jgi:hypothetical protein